MAFNVLTIGCLIITALLLLAAFRILFNPKWLLGWLRGSVGLLLIFLAVVIAIGAMDYASYRQLSKETQIASISFAQINDKQYTATVVETGGGQSKFQLFGDLWQVDARIIKWSGSMARLGFTPSYRLARLSGRYFALEDERTGTKSVFDMNSSKYGVDVWRWIQNNPFLNGFVDAKFGSATFMPMADGALYAVVLTHNGLMARPLNEPAETAANNW